MDEVEVAPSHATDEATLMANLRWQRTHMDDKDKRGRTPVRIVLVPQRTVDMHQNASRDQYALLAAWLHGRFIKVNCCDTSSRRRVAIATHASQRTLSDEALVARTEDLPEGNDRYSPEQRRQCFESMQEATTLDRSNGSLVLERQLRCDALVDCTDEFAQRKADDAVSATGQWRSMNVVVRCVIKRGILKNDLAYYLLRALMIIIYLLL